MRVEALNQVSQIYQTTNSKKTTKAEEIQGKERYEVSSFAKEYQIAKNAVKEAPDIREDKIKKLQEAISTGTYNVSAQEIADKMVGKLFDLG